MKNDPAENRREVHGEEIRRDGGKRSEEESPAENGREMQEKATTGKPQDTGNSTAEPLSAGTLLI